MSSSHRVLYTFLLVVTGAMAWLAYLAYYRSFGETPIASFHDLQDVYRKEGLDRFREEKEKLRASVSEELKNPKDSESQNNAANIALYLFPTELPSGDLERQVGEEEWAPLQQEIEKVPGTERSRELFEEMRANIWNYESPSRVSPQLTAQAQQVLKIYKTLSNPE